MKLKELYELLDNIEAKLSKKQKELETLNTRLKTATDDDLDTLVKQAEDLKSAIEALKTQQTDTTAQVDNAEKALEELAEKSKDFKGKMKGTVNMDYLKTKQAGLDFAKLLVENKGSSMKDLMKEWRDNLKEKGVTGLEQVIPQAVILSVQEAFVNYAGVLNHVSTDPRYAAKVVFQNLQAWAKGHKKGATKKNVDVDFTSFTINSDTVYIKAMFDYKDLKLDTDGTYFNHVMKQLADGLIRSVERAIVIGDGLDANDPDKITEIKSIAEETLAELFDTQDFNASASEYQQSHLEALTAGVDKMVASGAPILVTTKENARKLKLIKGPQGKYIDPQPFAPIKTDGNVIHGYTTYVYDWMEEAENPIISFADKAYTMTGDAVGADKFEQYDVTVNQRHTELVGVMGGRLSAYKAAIKFTAETPK